MQRASATAMVVANWLSRHVAVENVYYTGLPSHPQFELACRQQGGHGGVVSFTLCGGRESAWRFIDSLQMIARCTNIGDTRTMVTHPATTTHCKLTLEERHAAGIHDNLIRLSIGMEDSKDLLFDLQQALSAAMQPMDSLCAAGE